MTTTTTYDFDSGHRSTIEVRGPHPYSVELGSGLTADIADAAAATGADTVAVIHQPPLADRVGALAEALRGRGMKTTVLPIPDAEYGKRVEVLAGLWEAFAEAGMNRQDLVVSLGGGAATDLAGFAAATWMRGIKVIHVPTTLLGMVDAAVGGKTGINIDSGKNLVGAFHEPQAVFVDTDYLRTLPHSDLVAGSGEIIKTGFIADDEILRRYEQDPASCLQVTGLLPELIHRSIAVKARVVAADLTESSLREMLNYGHTFGHAVEKQEHFRWRHGNAVAVGMMFVAQLARHQGLIDAALVDRHRCILESVGLPVSYSGAGLDELIHTMLFDKKTRSGRLRFVALDGGVGRITRITDPGREALAAAYAAIQS